LFLVPAGAPGLSLRVGRRVDGRPIAQLGLDGVEVRESDRLGRPDEAGPLLDRLFDRAAVCLAAESLGGMAEVFELTLAHLKTRRQFGVPIGSFQALRHRAAALFCERELLRSVVRAALVAIDEDAAALPRLACAAKARAADAFLHAAAEAIQMHGGIGVTDELDVGLYYKRARVAEVTLGDAAFWRARFARLPAGAA
jgi:alkylation response protein AidB-like acyl-CoA dehydrogenase